MDAPNLYWRSDSRRGLRQVRVYTRANGQPMQGNKQSHGGCVAEVGGVYRIDHKKLFCERVEGVTEFPHLLDCARPPTHR